MSDKAKYLESRIFKYAVHKLLGHAGAVPGVGTAVAILSYFSFQGKRGENLVQLIPIIGLALLLDYLGGVLADPFLADPVLGVEDNLNKLQKAARHSVLWPLVWLLEELVDRARDEAMSALGMSTPKGVYSRSRYIMKLLDKWDEHRVWIELSKAARILMFLPALHAIDARWSCGGDTLASLSNLFAQLPWARSYWFVATCLVTFLGLRAMHQALLYRALAEKTKSGYRDMAEFIDSVDSVNDNVRALDDVATKGKRALRRFNDVLQERFDDVLQKHPEERERWFAFQKERGNRRIRRLLESEGIYVVTP